MRKELRDAILQQHACRDLLMKILFCNSKPRRRKRWRLFAILLTTPFVLQIAKPTAALKSTQSSSTNHSRKKKEKKKAMTNPLQFFWRLLCPADCKTDPQLEDDETSCKMNCEKQIGETIARVLTDSLLSQSSNLHNSSPHKSLLFLFFCFRIPRWRRCNGESKSLWHGHCSESLQELGSLCAPAGMTNTQKRQP